MELCPQDKLQGLQRRFGRPPNREHSEFRWGLQLPVGMPSPTLTVDGKVTEFKLGHVPMR